jgi:hypothetical protein
MEVRYGTSFHDVSANSDLLPERLGQIPAMNAARFAISSEPPNRERHGRHGDAS